MNALNFSDFTMGSLLDIPGKIVDFFATIVDMITSVMDALLTLYSTLEDFDQTVVAMVDSNGTSEFTGMPVVEAISTFHYLVGDVAFYMIYLTVLFGCLWTIYKLVVLLYEAIDALVEQVTGQNCKSVLTGILGKLFKS